MAYQFRKLAKIDVADPAPWIYCWMLKALYRIDVLPGTRRSSIVHNTFFMRASLAELHILRTLALTKHGLHEIAN